MIEQLVQQIWDRPAFRSEYHALLRHNLESSLGVQSSVNAPEGAQALKRLLQSATHFACSSGQQFREAAYRIATAALVLHGKEFANLTNITSLILERLGNFPTIDLVNRDSGDAHIDNLPQGLRYEYLNKKLENSVSFDGSGAVLTDFQKRLWNSLFERVSVAVTAPTSAGKSFALQRFIASSLIGASKWCLYIVPTRALLNQVSVNLIKLFHALGHDEIEVCTIPIAPAELGSTAGVYVLTQERLQILLDLDPNLRFELAVVDEAQMLGDGGRGVILESVIGKLRTRMPGIQLLFGSPQTKNPGVFQSVFGLDRLEIVDERESPVAQNLIFVDTDSVVLNQVRISALIEERPEELGVVKLEASIYDEDQTLSYLSWYLGKSDKSLVYSGGPASCEKVAVQVSQLIERAAEGRSRNESQTAILQEFSVFLKEHIHPEYVLSETVLNNVGFHYGNMPAVVRRTVEDFFGEGLLDFIVCTSTLLHGVNLPAKNLFLLNPTKGRDWDSQEDIPISSLEFWNLAGRAGRLGKEFEGNVFLIDHSKWQSDPLEGERRQDVEPSSVKTVRDHSVEFVAFIENGNHPSGSSPAEENAFMKLFIDLRKGKLEATLENIYGDGVSPAKEKISTALDSVAAKINVPSTIFEKHISVSVIRQQQMLDHLVAGIAKNDPRRYIPVHPLKSEAHKSMVALMKRIHNFFEMRPKEDKSHLYFAPLALKWMRGEPLRRLIESAVEYRTKKRQRINIATIIRSIMQSVEQDLCFRYVKFISCYSDLLSEALKRTDNADFASHIPNISLYLEIGASSQTMINLVGLGLTRTAAAIVTERSADKDMDRLQAEQFLLQGNWKALGVSPIILREIQRITD